MTQHQSNDPIPKNAIRRGEAKKLPNKRNATTYEARVGGVEIEFSVGEYPDGTPGEIFIDTCKDGSTLRSLYNCLAIAVSIGLQYGAPLEEYVSFFTSMSFIPSGFVDGHEKIKDASSMVDFIFRAIALDYLKIDKYSDDPNQKTELIFTPKKKDDL